jgi:NADH-quinone oxidoreductase subunit B
MALARFRLAADPSVEVVHLPLACCAVEVDAAVAAGLLLAAPGEGPVSDPPRRRVLLVAGTVTTALVPVLDRARDLVGPDAVVVAYGACASSGGPYWDAPSVVPGADRLGRVDHYIPGCPPGPRALAAGVLAAIS